MGMELEFTREQVELPGYGLVEYDWAFQEIEHIKRLIFHFFLKKGKADPQFQEALQRSALNVAAPGIEVENFYTDIFDGTDLVITGDLKAYAVKIMKDAVVNRLKQLLEK